MAWADSKTIEVSIPLAKADTNAANWSDSKTLLADVLLAKADTNVANWDDSGWNQFLGTGTAIVDISRVVSDSFSLSDILSPPRLQPAVRITDSFTLTDQVRIDLGLKVTDSMTLSDADPLLTIGLRVPQSDQDISWTDSVTRDLYEGPWLDSINVTVESIVTAENIEVPGLQDSFSLSDGELQGAEIFLALSDSTPQCKTTQTISWDPSPEVNIAGYFIYYGEATQRYSWATKIDVGNVTSYTITGLSPGVSYYAIVTAVTTEGFESNYSNVVYIGTDSIDYTGVDKALDLMVMDHESPDWEDERAKFLGFVQGIEETDSINLFSDAARIEADCLLGIPDDDSANWDDSGGTPALVVGVIGFSDNLNLWADSLKAVKDILLSLAGDSVAFWNDTTRPPAQTASFSDSLNNWQEAGKAEIPTFTSVALPPDSMSAMQDAIRVEFIEIPASLSDSLTLTDAEIHGFPEIGFHTGEDANTWAGTVGISYGLCYPIPDDNETNWGDSPDFGIVIITHLYKSVGDQFVLTDEILPVAQVDIYARPRKTKRHVRDDVLYRLGDSSNTIWSNAEIDSYIQQGYDEFCLTTLCIWKRDVLEDVSGQAEYTLPTDFYQMDRATWDNQRVDPLRTIDLQGQDRMYRTATGQVYGYVMDQDGLRVLRKWHVPVDGTGVIITPAITTTGTYGIPRMFAGESITGTWGIPRTLPSSFGGTEDTFGIPRIEPVAEVITRPDAPKDFVIEYYARGAELISDDTELGIPEIYTRAIRHFAIAKALERDGPGQDLKLAAHFMGRYQVGVTRAKLRKNRVQAQKIRQMGGPSNVNQKPSRPILPWQYGKVIR